MKIFLTALALSSAGAMAATECTTGWLYHPYGSCRAQSNPLDRSYDMDRVPVEQQETKHDFGEDCGGAGRAEFWCNTEASVTWFNEHKGKEMGAIATKSRYVDDGSSSHPSKAADCTHYRYSCYITYKLIPHKDEPNKDCPNASPKWAFQRGQYKDTVPTKVKTTCLSCDTELMDEGPLEGVKCLRDNITNVVNKLPNFPEVSKDLQPEDFYKISDSVLDVLDYNQRTPILSIRGDKQLFDAYLAAHPLPPDLQRQQQPTSPLPPVPRQQR